jgi:hypothetical protein
MGDDIGHRTPIAAVAAPVGGDLVEFVFRHRDRPDGTRRRRARRLDEQPIGGLVLGAPHFFWVRADNF